jgi:hypothetical protein
MRAFFIKVLLKDVGKNMIHGESESMKAIRKDKRFGSCVRYDDCTVAYSGF